MNRPYRVRSSSSSSSSSVRLVLRDERSILTVSDAGDGFANLGAIRRGESGAGSTGLGLDIVARAAQESGVGVRIGRSRDGGGEISVVFGAFHVNSDS